MTLSGFRVLDKSAVVCFLFVVGDKRGPQGRKLLVGFQPAKALLEACPSAHHWSRKLQVLGHAAKLMPPSYASAAGIHVAY